MGLIPIQCRTDIYFVVESTAAADSRAKQLQLDQALEDEVKISTSNYK